MSSLRTFFGLNRGPVIVAVLLAVASVAAFPVLLGLHPTIGVVLATLVAGATIGIHRRLWPHERTLATRLGGGRLALSGVLGLLLIALLIQAVPYGWSRSNPPVTAEPPWDSVRTRELTVRACFDCHSNEVDYPWYSRLAPISWAVQLHVDGGREAVN